jgi:hypothetical protein
MSPFGWRTELAMLLVGRCICAESSQWVIATDFLGFIAQQTDAEQ